MESFEINGILPGEGNYDHDYQNYIPFMVGTATHSTPPKFRAMARVVGLGADAASE